MNDKTLKLILEQSNELKDLLKLDKVKPKLLKLLEL
jgi:hypothetical protein